MYYYSLHYLYPQQNICSIQIILLCDLFVKYVDKKYTKYEALQRQRKLETTMRAQRQKIKLLEQGKADEDDIIAARGRYRVTSQEYSRFSKAMDLPQQRERVTVDGLGDIGKGKWKKSNKELHRKSIILIETQVKTVEKSSRKATGLKQVISNFFEAL